MAHLWEAEHSYYCSETNFYSNEPYTKHATWHAFAAAFAEADLDMNMVFRFDWREGDDDGAGPFNGDVYYRNGVLQMFFVFQRKGIFADLWRKRHWPRTERRTTSPTQTEVGGYDLGWCAP